MKKEYRCEATSLEGFIQQLGVCYVGRGYFYYVTGIVPDEKDPRVIDQKLIEKYDITWKKWKRAYRKSQGLANMQYIRFGRFFVLLCSDGDHIFRERERRNIRDARKNAIHFGGYQVAFRNGHPQIRIAPQTYKELKAYYVGLSVRRKKETLISEFYRFPFEPYHGVKRP